MDTNALDNSAVTYSSLFGTIGTNCTAIADFRYKSVGRISIGITRYGSAAVDAQGDEVATVQFKLVSGCYGGWFRLKPYVLACDSASGALIPVSVIADSVQVIAASPAQPSGVNDLSAESIDIYPNPAATLVSLMGADRKGIYTISMTDALGQRVRDLVYTGAPVDVSDLSSGIYNVCIQSGASKIYRKLIVVR